MVYPLPRDPWMNGPGGAYFDGRQAHNLTNNPYLNTIFEGVNHTQDMIQFAGPNAWGGGYNANQQFLNNFINPIIGRATEQYQAGMAIKPEEEESGGFLSGLFRGVGDFFGGILELPGNLIGGIFDAVGLGFVGDIVRAPGELLGGITRGIGDAAGGIVSTLSFGLL